RAAHRVRHPLNRRQVSFIPCFPKEKMMFAKLVGVLAVVGGLTFVGLGSAAEKEAGCCGAKLACCTKGAACCAAPVKEGCCAQARLRRRAAGLRGGRRGGRGGKGGRRPRHKGPQGAGAGGGEGLRGRRVRGKVPLPPGGGGPGAARLSRPHGRQNRTHAGDPE